MIYSLKENPLLWISLCRVFNNKEQRTKRIVIFFDTIKTELLKEGGNALLAAVHKLVKKHCRAVR